MHSRMIAPPPPPSGPPNFFVSKMKFGTPQNRIPSIPTPFPLHSSRSPSPSLFPCRPNLPHLLPPHHLLPPRTLARQHGRREIRLPTLQRQYAQLHRPEPGGGGDAADTGARVMEFRSRARQRGGRGLDERAEGVDVVVQAAIDGAAY